MNTIEKTQNTVYIVTWTVSTSENEIERARSPEGLKERGARMDSRTEADALVNRLITGGTATNISMKEEVITNITTELRTYGV